MTPAIALAVAALFVTIIGGFAGTMRAIGRLEAKFEIVWQWYCDETQRARDGGRRRLDPAQRWQAHDDGEPDGG